MKTDNLKQGDLFTGIVSGNRVKGMIYNYSSTTSYIYLLNNAVGEVIPPTAGYTRRYYAGNETDYFDIVNLKIVDQEEYDNYKEDVFTTAFNFTVRIRGDKFIFGCGAVKLTREQVKRELKRLKNNSILNFGSRAVRKAISDYLSLDKEDIIKEAEKLLNFKAN